MRNLGQNVPHEVDLTPLSARSHKLLLNRSMNTAMGIGYAQADLPQASLLQFAEKPHQLPSDSSNIGSMANISLSPAPLTPCANISASTDLLRSVAKKGTYPPLRNFGM